MTTIIETAKVIEVLANVLHQDTESGLWFYDDGWDDKRVGVSMGVTEGQVRGIRTQLKRKLIPKERAFEKLVRLHNELCNRTANGDLVFEYVKKKEG